MVMRKPTDLDGNSPPPTGAANAALPYDPEEWERRLEAARERRTKILALRGAAADLGAPSRPQAVSGADGAAGGGGRPDAEPGLAARILRARAEAANGQGAGTAFEGRMDRIARAVESARARSAPGAPRGALPEVVESAPARSAAAAPETAGPQTATRAEPARQLPQPSQPPARSEQVAPAVSADTQAAAPRRRFPRTLLAAAAFAAVVLPGAYLWLQATAPDGRPTPPVDAAEAGTLAVPEAPQVEMPPLRPAAAEADPGPGPLPLLQVAARPAAPSGPLGAAPEPLPAAAPEPAVAALSDRAAEAASVAAAAPSELSAPDLPASPALPTGEASTPEVTVAPLDAPVPPEGPAPAAAEVAPIADPGSYMVTVNAAPGAAAAEIADVTAALAGAGFPDRRPQPVGFTVSRTHLRYYHAADAEAAREIAARIGAEARDFTHFRPSPPTGKIEVWIAGTAPAVRRATGSAGSPQPLPNPVQAARQIGQALRHLVDTFPANERP